MTLRDTLLDGFASDPVVRADSFSTVPLTAHLIGEDSADRRAIIFRATSGTFITGTGTVSAGSATLIADASGQARVLWRATRLAGSVPYSISTEDSLFHFDGTISTTAAYPDHILLTSPQVEYSDSDSVATLNAALFTDQGYHTRGLGLTFEAYRLEGSSEVPVGNFLASPYQVTNAGGAHTIDLDLSVPGVGDSIFVKARCGVESNVLLLHYAP